MWFKKTNLIRVISCTMMFFHPFWVNSKEITGVGTIDNKYYELLLNEKYIEAFNYISNPITHNAKLNLAYHYILGTGTTIDICKAVEILEKNYIDRDFYLRTLLNLAYNSSWETIAALEGDHNASFRVGQYYYGLYMQRKYTDQSALDVHHTILRNAYTHFMRAKKFGDADAGAFLEKILKIRPDFRETLTVDYSTKSIICPAREH